MMKVTVFKQKPYSEEYTNPLGVKTFRTMDTLPIMLMLNRSSI